MNFNSDFDLRKAKSFLLTESKVNERLADKMWDVNPLTAEKERVIYETEEYRMGIFDDIDADLMEEEDRIGYLDAIIKYCTKQMEDVGNDNGGLDDTNSLDETEELDEMAKIAGDLKSAIEKVIAANTDLEGLSLKKAIKGDSAVIDALDGEDLYDNQLNKFIALSKGERTVGQRGRKADPNKPAAEPKAEKSPKIKITTPKTAAAPTSKLSDLAPKSVFGGEEADEEDMAAEKQAIAAAKGGKRLGSAAEKLAQVTKEMKALIPAYQAAKGTPKAAIITSQLKDLTAEKKALEAKVFK
ncbi:hypothetical protein N9795_00210 [Candidatus Pelagibacter sp.]|nr:hypothetical protein [Candidatus Pelagibacter sp.]